jgi:hypothetical protein
MKLWMRIFRPWFGLMLSREIRVKLQNHIDDLLGVSGCAENLALVLFRFVKRGCYVAGVPDEARRQPPYE